MNSVFTRWFKRNLSNPQTAVLIALLILGFAVILLFGKTLAPVLTAIVLAYLLDWLVEALTRLGLPRIWSVILVFILFIGLSVLLVFGIIPVIVQQVSNLISELPSILQKAQTALESLPQQYPEYVSEQQVSAVLSSLSMENGSFGLEESDLTAILSASLSSLVGIVSFLVYLILVPLMIFFFLKDRDMIIGWFANLLPQEHHLAARVWTEVNEQLGNYVRGKAIEIIIVGSASYIVFAYLGLSYALLLAVLVGFSVLVPYVGAAVVTVPVALIAYFQWGFTANFYWLMGAYLLIQALDGNLLVPVLFSEAVNLHPVAIIGSILFFGGIWGFWGVFFAIPLATLVAAVMKGFREIPSGNEPGNEAVAERELAAETTPPKV